MSNKINLITGETYTLCELFSGKRRIIIPDLQRDYCWGSKNDKISSHSLVDGFIETLLKQFNSHPFGKLSLGLLYGYECPDNYVQLCDGQQRITTLFLLLGMLNRWCGDDRYRHYLISDFEFFEDDHEPYLQYSIRESSLYFMSDLVYNFFTNGSGDHLKDINAIYDNNTGQSCAWFYGEYTTDPSIMSMLQCLASIENVKERVITNEDSERLDKFVEFLVNRLTFIYYDMGTRTNGEETFVIINTTGEPLSATENLKPLVINAEINKPFGSGLLTVGQKSLPIPKAWEEMENFFWKIRDKKEFDTADNGFNEFLRWVTLLEIYDSENQTQFKEYAKEETIYRFPYEKIGINKIIETYNAFLRFRTKYSEYYGVTNDGISRLGEGVKLTQRQLFVLLPILAYLRKHANEDSRQVRRLGEFLRNVIRIDNVNKAVNDLLRDVILIGFTITDITEIIDLDVISHTILTNEEKFKLLIQKQCPDETSRRRLEESIWDAQAMEVDCIGQSLFSGEILPLLIWSTTNCTLNPDNFCYNDFEYYLEILSQILTTEDNDLTRRALLAFGYKGIPWRENSYGWGGTWKSIIAENPESFRRFLNEVKSRGRKAIIAFCGSNNPIVKYDGILKYSDRKNFGTWSISGNNVCKRSYAAPIPVVLAEIMAKVGAIIMRGTQACGDWWLNMTNEGKLEFIPKDDASKRIDKITVSAINAGKKLRYDIVTPTYEFSVVLPLSSADALIDRILSRSQKPITLSCFKLQQMCKRGHHRLTNTFRKKHLYKRPRYKH